MSRGKTEQNLVSRLLSLSITYLFPPKKQRLSSEEPKINEQDVLGRVPYRLQRETLSYIPNSAELPLKTMAQLARLSKNYHVLFQPVLTEAREALPLLTSVVHSNCDALMQQVEKDPELFFKKGQITDPDGQTFYNVSAYQLMIFLCDGDMRDQVIPLLPATFEKKTKGGVVTTNLEALREKQYAELGGIGGSDLVKLDRDPLKMEFVEITRFKASYTMWQQCNQELVYPLLENPDGIIFYQNAKQEINLYYANQTTQTVTLINLSKEQRQALNGLFVSFALMENNSSRRSSNEEHELIARIMKRTLARKGILYEQGGVGYCDNRMSFSSYINNIRACIRLTEAGYHEEANALWRSGVGRAERQVLWLLARICEYERPFAPMAGLVEPPFDQGNLIMSDWLAHNFKEPFKRGFVIRRWPSQKVETVFSKERLADGLGRDFAICKAKASGYASGRSGRNDLMFRCDWPLDLLAVLWLIKDGKARVAQCGLVKEKKASEDVSSSPSASGLGL